MPEVVSVAFGSLAPPLDAAKIAEYRKLADQGGKADRGAGHEQVREAMNKLLDMAEAYLAGPVAKAKVKAAGPPHPSGMGTIVLLPDDEVRRIWDVVPWDEELEMYKEVFDRIDPVSEKPLRDAAFHLAWLGRELFLDREPRFKPPKPTK